MQCGSVLRIASIINHDADADVQFLVFDAILVELGVNGAHSKVFAAAAVGTRALSEIILKVLIQWTAFLN